jgi:hypothetical protein
MLPLDDHLHTLLDLRLNGIAIACEFRFADVQRADISIVLL